MSGDEATRQLAREWETGQDPDVGTRLGLARIRAGEELPALEPELGALVLTAWLERGRLEPRQARLAAVAGLAAALRLHPDVLAEHPTTESESLEAASSRLVALFQVEGVGKEAWRHWIVAILRRLTTTFEMELPDAGLAERLLGWAEAYAAAPSTQQAKRVSEECQVLEDWIEQGLLGPHYLATLRARGREDANEWGRRAHSAWRWTARLAGLLAGDDLRYTPYFLREWSSTIDPGFDPYQRALEVALEVALAPSPNSTPSSAPVAYSPRRTYQLGERVVHKTFGEGEVTRAAGRQVEVRFGDQVKKLAQGL